jgi:hypothetical protein
VQKTFQIHFNPVVTPTGNVQPAPVTLKGTAIAYNQLGCALIMDGEEQVAAFPLGGVLGVYTEDGASRIQGVSGILKN